MLYWDAFASLSKSRGYSLRFGKKDTQYICPDPIVFSEIVSYSGAIEIKEVEPRMQFIRIIQEVDEAYVATITAKVK